MGGPCLLDLPVGMQLMNMTDIIGRNMVLVIGREAAMEANASAFSLESLGMCSSFQTRKLFKRCFTRETYFAIRGSQDSNSRLTCPTTNWEVTPNQESVGKQGSHQFEPG